MGRDNDVKVFHVRIKFHEGTEQIEQFSTKHYRKVMSMIVTPMITGYGVKIYDKQVKFVELYKPVPGEIFAFPIIEKKCIRPDGDCFSCFVSNETIKNTFDV